MLFSSHMDKSSAITPIQLASLLIAGSAGSAIVYIPNPLADVSKNGAWLSLLAAYLFGMVVLSCVLYLHRSHGGASLIQYSRLLVGKWLTLVIAAPYIGMLLFAIPAIDAGIGDFFTSVMMNETPSYVFNSLSLIAAALTAQAGIKVIARMFLLLVFIMLSFSIAVMLLAVPIYNPTYLLPLMPMGVKPILHGFFIAAGFPFGEVVLFSMLLPFVSKDKSTALAKGLYLAFTVTGIMLICSVLSAIMTFGPASGYFQYSLFKLASEIQIAEIIQRIESVIGIALILGSYMKLTLFLLILSLLITQLANLSDERVVIYPLTLICILLSLTMFQSPADFYEQVYVIWPFTVLTAGCSVIFLLTLITYIKRKSTSSGTKGGMPHDRE